MLEEKVVVSSVLRRFKVEAAHKPEDAILEVVKSIAKNELNVTTSKINYFRLEWY